MNGLRTLYLSALEVPGAIRPCLVRLAGLLRMSFLIAVRDTMRTAPSRITSSIRRYDIGSCWKLGTSIWIEGPQPRPLHLQTRKVLSISSISARTCERWRTQWRRQPIQVRRRQLPAASPPFLWGITRQRMSRFPPPHSKGTPHRGRPGSATC